MQIRERDKVQHQKGQQNNQLQFQKNQLINQEQKIEQKKQDSPYFSKKSHKYDHLSQISYKKNPLPSINMISKGRSNSIINEQYFLTHSKLYKNKHLQYLYKNFCKQMVKGGQKRTFDQIQQSGDKMPLTKWMIFCKEFQLTKKLSSKDSIDIFKKATNFYSQMTYLTFIKGLQLAKNRGNIQEKQLVKDLLHVNNHYDARDKLGNLKIHHNGPQRNFFDESLYTNYQRVARPRKQYKKQIIYQQGKISQRQERQIRQKNFLNQEKKKQKMNLYLSNYSQASHKAYSSYQRNNLNKQKKDKQRQNSSINQKGDSINLKQQDNQNRKLSHSMLQNPKRNIKLNIQQKKISEQPVKKEWEKDSDTESDDILRQHYQTQKQSNKITVLNKLKLKKQLNEEEQQQDKETTMMITQYRQ